MKLFEFIPEGIQDCRVRARLHMSDSEEIQNQMFPAVIVVPGGGYEFVSEREAEPVADAYYTAGFNTFILTYSIGEKATDFYPLRQLASTIAHVRKHSAEWCTEIDQIAVCGFSAGGHLACSLGTLFQEKAFLDAFGRDDYIRPNAMILSYPVITADEFAHVGSIEHVSGEKQGSAGYQWFSLDKHVTAQTCPAFLWHTANDEIVPVENSLKMAAALSHNKVPFELHIFPEGPHGMSVCTKEVGSECAYNARWVKLSIQWLRQLFA